MTSAVWQVLSVARVVDGDSLRLTRQRPVGVVDGLILLARDVEPVAVRLGWVDTPERGRDGYEKARQDLTFWINAALGPITATDLGRDSFGRRLMDLRNVDGQSASQWLMADRGWPPYTG